MRTGSLKTLCIGGLSKPDHVVQVMEELQHCTDLRELELKLLALEAASLHSTQELGLELELFDTVRHACCGLDMSLLCMQCLWRSVCVKNAHTPHTNATMAINLQCYIYFTL